MEPSERSWGITPVPDRLRTLSLLDVGLLWGNLGVSLLVLFTGTFLAGLGLQRALLATVVGAVARHGAPRPRRADRLRAARSRDGAACATPSATAARTRRPA